MRWAALVRPRVIILENVEEFQTWGPVLADGTPCPVRKGKTFCSFIHQLQEKGYAVEWRELRACDYGAPTIRKRLFLIGRCDGKPIVWPEPTHGAPGSAEVKARKRKPWRTAAECIDWSIPCPSIFTRKRPLAEATQRRIARGLRRYVIDAADPFVVQYRYNPDTGLFAPHLTKFRTGSTGADLRDPMPTITAGPRENPAGAPHALGIVAPTLVQTGYGERTGQAPRAPGLDKPLGTVVAGGAKHALVSAFLAKHYGGNYDGPGAGLDAPAHTVTTSDHHALVSSNLVKLRGECAGSATDSPAPTVTAGGTHIGEVRAFLVKYYGNEKDGVDVREPMHTIPCTDRMGLVTVAGEQYQIVDIGMRMLEPHELYAAQGFPSSYVIAPVIDGRPLPKHAQVRMCGNSVSPPMAAALVSANVPEMASWSAREKKERRIAA